MLHCFAFLYSTFHRVEQCHAWIMLVTWLHLQISKLQSGVAGVLQFVCIGGIFFSFLPPFLPQMASRGGRPLSAGRPLSGSKEKPGDIRHRRDKVLVKYQEFTDAVHSRRLKLEQAKQLHHFYTDADNLESWINDKIRIASDESYKDRRNLQARKYIATTILIAVVLYAKQYCTYIFLLLLFCCCCFFVG